jgi:hypothetical protein
MRTSLTDIQQAFVRRYMDDNGVIGVRIRRCDGDLVLFVVVAPDCTAELPPKFRGLRVVVEQGQRAVLAYC